MKPKHFLIVAVLIVSSCKITRDNLTGGFSCKPIPTIRLNLYKDSTFEFIKINKNPYLHPFEHPDEYFFVSTGYWKLSSSKELILNSKPNSRYSYKSPQVIEKPRANVLSSHFAFYDLYKKPVDILYVELQDKSTVMVLHRSMPDFSYDFSKGDTLKFYFYGYPPYTFIKNKRPTADYEIRLLPNLNSNYFSDKKLKAHKNRIVDANNKVVFKRMKNDSTIYQQ
jgi:hypothetical protein